MVRQDVAVVTVSDPVDGAKRRKSPRRTRKSSSAAATITVDKAVMAAAKEALRPGERLVIESATSVRTTYSV